MKTNAFLLLALLMASCTDLKSPTATTESYRVLETVREITPEQMGNRKAYAVALSGDTVFVAAFDSTSNSGVFLFSQETGERIGEITSWDNGKTTFTENVTCVAVDAKYIYIGEKSSRVDVFKRSDLSHYSTVGTGAWWGDEKKKMVHSFGIAAMDSLLYVRDKSSIRVFPQEYIRPETAWNVPLYAKVEALPTNTVPYGIVSVKNTVVATDFDLRALLILHNDSIQEAAFTVMPMDTIPLTARPFGITVHKDEFLVTLDNGTMESRSTQDGSLLQIYASIEGHVFENPTSIASEGDAFAVVEKSQGKVVLGKFTYSEVTYH